MNRKLANDRPKNREDPEAIHKGGETIGQRKLSEAKFGGKKVNKKENSMKIIQ